MAEPARPHVLDGEAVPEPIRHEEKTAEMPAVPKEILPEETAPVRSSLEKMLRQEVLRQRSARGDDQ
jgi:hypothetical protein